MALQEGKNKEEEEDSEDESDEEQEDGTKKKKKKRGKKKKKGGGAEEGAPVGDNNSSGGRYGSKVQDAHLRINVEQLSKKEELFQIRFIIHKARKLAGACTMPLLRVLLGSKILRTKPKKGRNPKWNETLLFSITKSEVDLVTESIEIRVIDSARTPQFALVGLYVSDLSIAWVEKGKNLFYKWFAMTNPDEPQDGLTGYVNISIQIIPPGESAKDLPKLRDEQIDVSDNVFFPPGIILQPGQFNIKLLNGEDIPQMDSSMFDGLKNLVTGDEGAKKELVDPYAKFEFAGTILESSVKETTFDPIWNELLIIQGNFPSMAETIILKLYDNDEFQIDDLIATKLLHMDQISHSSAEADQGFLPTFGPAYIPFYGSFREYSEVYDKYKDMNHGVGEGIAYRGRVLVELNTVMGEPQPDQELVSDLPPEETDMIMSHLSRHKYHLFASFFQGNMVGEKENQVEFEVSIGDYGNKFSPHGSMAPSTTQPCNAVYDGTKYHFMPWSRTKPTVILHSEWEDIEYRAESLNTLIWMKDFMNDKMDQYVSLEKAFAPEYEQDTKIDNNLKEIYDILSDTPLHDPDEEDATQLDKNLHEFRTFIINNLVEEVCFMIDGKFQYISRSDKVKRLYSVLEKMEELCFEPQLGIPDVFIWMLSGTKRIAYVRIPVNEIMYSKTDYAKGKHCGITGSFFLKEPKSETIGAHVTLTLWFGKFEDVNDTFTPPRGSEVIVYAETYENQMSVLGSWTTKLLPRPAFSDSTGKYSLHLDVFVPPDGWRFEDEWFISVDRSLTFDNETGLKEVSEVTYEGETRIPGTSWTGPLVSTWWQDIKGDEAPAKDQVECAEGWHWAGDWEVDTNRAVDADGWEYSLDSNISSYSPIERSYHLSRRKKWQRLRERNADSSQIKKKDIDPDGWEYSKIFTTKFHPKERKFDMVRRRRYNRRMVSSVPMPVVFQIVEEEAKGDKPPKIINNAPRIITEYGEKHVHKYQLRAYLYQARGVLGADPSGYSDPYARVIFGNRSAKTHVIKCTVSPVWDTTLILDAVEICGYPEDIANDPPRIIVDIFDEDVLDHDQLGRVVVQPVVFNSGKYDVTKLKWYPIGGVKKSKGDLLAAFEAFKLGADGIELPLLPKFENEKYIVPEEIRPEKQLMRVEVLTWGVRQLKDYKMLPIESPHADIEIGGETITIDKIPSLKKHPNFAVPFVYFDVWLPVREEFLPPINIRVMDNRAFGYTPLVAVATMKEYGRYRTTYSGVMAEAEEEEHEDVGEEAEILKEIMAGGLFGGIDDDSLCDEQYSEITSVAQEQDETSLASYAPMESRLTDDLTDERRYEGSDVEVESDAPKGSYGHEEPSETVLPIETQGISERDVVLHIEREEEVEEELQLEASAEIQINMEIEVDHMALLSDSADFSDSKQQLIPKDEGDDVSMSYKSEHQDFIISNEAAVTAEMTEPVGNGVSDITIAIPQGDINDTKEVTPVDNKAKKQVEKELKKQEKVEKKQAKLRKKEEAKEKKSAEKERKRVEKKKAKEAKELARAAYREEQEKKKLLLDIDASDEESSDEEFLAEDCDSPLPILSSGGAAGDSIPGEVPEKAAGLLGMWYGTNEPQEDPKNTITKLSRKETRKLKQGDEEREPHPDDILVSDWWSKYYHALGKDQRLERVFKERNLPTLKSYEEELEKAHGRFRDIMEVVKLQRPDNELSSDFEEDSEDEDAHVGLFKGSFKIYPITEEMHKRAEIEPPELMFQNLPTNSPQDVTVRLYIVAGMNLTPLDFGGSVDPYLWVKCGKTIIDDKSNYQTRQINPEFGRLFEFRCSLPRDSQLMVKVMDHDLIGANDLVGSTTIDLEDRFLSWRHASCGVATHYIVDKENKDLWRDTVKPISLLKNICVLKGWKPPTFKGKGSTLRLYVSGSEYKMKFFESNKQRRDIAFQKTYGKDEQRLALYVLHELDVIPEHFETRTLYNDDCPGIPQGKIHLWVDIFPHDRNLPNPVNITPRATEKMVLRLIVWNTQDVILSDENIMGERMSDIYVKIHLEGMTNDAQQTDVHYRSLTGEGNFNWRMTYDFDYLMAEQKTVAYTKKSFFSLDREMEKLDPTLHIKVYDYDIFSSDDLLGWAELSLVALVPPTKTHKECKLDVYETPVENRISIFEKKKIKGFWPVFDDSLGEQELTGKVELEIQILTEAEALEKPAGQGRSEPNDNPILEPPDRPTTSFSFFMNPLMVFKILIWDKYKWKILLAFLILLLIAFIGLLFYTSPGAITASIFG